MRLSDNFEPVIFFNEKTLNAQKRKSNQNQLTKQNQANKKQQRQQVFARTRTSKRVKIVFFCILVLFYAQDFVKKNWLEIVLITSFYYAMYVYPYQPTYRAFLFVTICENLFLWELFFIRENVFFFMRILFHLWEFFFMRTLFYLWESMYLWK